MEKTKAQLSLTLQETRILDAQYFLKNNLQPRDVSKLVGNVFGYHGVSQIVQKTARDNTDREIWVYAFTYSVGVKCVSDKDDDEDDPITEIKAKYVAEYASLEELNQDDIDGFSKQNVGYHIWPFWREFVQSSLTRMGLPNSTIRVPFYFAANEPSEKRASDSPE